MYEYESYSTTHAIRVVLHESAITRQYMYRMTAITRASSFLPHELLCWALRTRNQHRACR